MAVDRVAIKAELGIQHHKVAIGGYNQRVDLEHLHVFFDESTIEKAHQADTLLDLPAGQTKRKCNASPVIGHVPGGGVDGEAEDLLWRFSRDLFDIHAAFGRADKADTAGLPVNQEGEVKLARDAGAVLDIDAVDLLALGASLMRDERAPEHALGFFCGFVN